MKLIKYEEVQKYNRIMKEKIIGKTSLNENEVTSKFYGIRLLSDEEKDEYFYREKKVLKEIRDVSIIILILLLIVFIQINKFVSGFLYLGIFALILPFAFIIYYLISTEKNLRKKEKDSKIYLGDCYVYELVIENKRYRRGPRIKTYWGNVKITDNVKTYLDKKLNVYGDTIDKTNSYMIKA